MEVLTAGKQGLPARSDQPDDYAEYAVIDGRGRNLRRKCVGGFDCVHEIAEQKPFFVGYGDDMDEV